MSLYLTSFLTQMFSPVDLVNLAAQRKRGRKSPKYAFDSVYQPQARGDYWNRVCKLHTAGQTLPAAFVKEVLWEQAVSIHLHIVCGCFHATMAEVGTCDRECKA